MLEANDINPYKNRTLPVGSLAYTSKYGFNSFLKIPAQLEKGEKELIFDIPELTEGGVFCNLGDAAGGSAILLALGLKLRSLSGCVYTVDVYDNKKANKAKENYKEFKVQKLIWQCQGESKKWAEVWTHANLLFDFVFIDADHSYSGVLNDIKLYAPLIKPRKYIAFHDTNQEQVMKAITDSGLIHNFEWIRWVNRIKLYQKI